MSTQEVTTKRKPGRPKVSTRVDSPVKVDKALLERIKTVAYADRISAAEWVSTALFPAVQQAERVLADRLSQNPIVQKGE